MQKMYEAKAIMDGIKDIQKADANLEELLRILQLRWKRQWKKRILSGKEVEFLHGKKDYFKC